MKKISLHFIIFLAAWLLVAPIAMAAELFVLTDQVEMPTEYVFTADVLVDTEGQSLNAFEGTIAVSSDYFEVIDIKASRSVVDFWIDSPVGGFADDPNRSSFDFAGIVAGGFEGSGGNIFELILKTKQQEGEGYIGLNNTKALVNDGLGTEAPTKPFVLNINISEHVEVSDIIVIDIKDNDAPEIFSPIISQIPDIAGDNYLLVFSTKDKGVGMDYYQIKEGLGRWHSAESPYILRNQKLNVDISVKAVDKNGNERIVKLPARYSKEWYEKYEFFAILIGVIILAFIAGRFKWKIKK